MDKRYCLPGCTSDNCDQDDGFHFCNVVVSTMSLPQTAYTRGGGDVEIELVRSVYPDGPRPVRISVLGLAEDMTPDEFRAFCFAGLAVADQADQIN
jgi:hypothetical protein